MIRRSLTIVFCLAFCWPAAARYKMSTDKPVKVNSEASSSHSASGAPHSTQSSLRSSDTRHPTRSLDVDEKQTLQELSQRYGVDVNRLEYLRSLRYGYELLVPALVIAHESQVDIGRILKSKMDGDEWDKICEDNMVDPKEVDKQAMESLSTIRMNLPKKALAEKPQNRD